MKVFLYKVAIFFLFVFCMDRAFGFFHERILANMTQGRMGKENYICNEADEDILVFGSSRAVHHYNSSILEDSLGLSCYNCGQNGNGVILAYPRLQMCLNRHRPKLIIYDITKSFDLVKGDNAKYLRWLRPRYDYRGVPEIFESIDPMEKYKMKSYMYRYNSDFLRDLRSYFSPKVLSFDKLIKGYNPLLGAMDPLKIRKESKDAKKEEIEYDSLKLDYLNKFIDLAQGSQLVFVYSPEWYGSDVNDLTPLLDICKKRNIPFLNFSNDEKYVHKNVYFKDGSHLNSVGADEFTKDLIAIIKSRMTL